MKYYQLETLVYSWTYKFVGCHILGAIQYQYYISAIYGYLSHSQDIWTILPPHFLRSLSRLFLSKKIRIVSHGIFNLWLKNHLHSIEATSGRTPPSRQHIPVESHLSYENTMEINFFFLGDPWLSTLLGPWNLFSIGSAWKNTNFSPPDSHLENYPDPMKMRRPL